RRSHSEALYSAHHHLAGYFIAALECCRQESERHHDYVDAATDVPKKTDETAAEVEHGIPGWRNIVWFVRYNHFDSPGCFFKFPDTSFQTEFQSVLKHTLI